MNQASGPDIPGYSIERKLGCGGMATVYLARQESMDREVALKVMKPALSDFGIACAIGSGTRMTATGLSIGTPHYMSPEQARGKPVEGRSDLYVLGIVFHEMLTGEVPFDAEDSVAVDIMHVQDPAPQMPSARRRHRRDRVPARPGLEARPVRWPSWTSRRASW